MTLNDFLSKFKGGANPPPFVAPVTSSTQKVFTKVGGLPYKYTRLRGIPNGWNRFKFNRSGILEIDAKNPPQPLEVQNYLQLLKPRLCLIVLYRLDARTFLTYPYNVGDARQKGWGEAPIVVNLVSDTLEAFDVIYARGEIDNMIYEVPSGIQIANREFLLGLLGRAPSVTEERFVTVEIRTSFSIINSRIMDAQRQESEAARRKQTLTIEGRIKYNLEFLGAELMSWRESGEDIVIQWKDQGQNYTSRISNKMGTVSAGICLSGKDADFNVAAMVDVIREARKIRREVRVGIGEALTEEQYNRVHPAGGYDEGDDDDDY